jgi:copper chaperone
MQRSIVFAAIGVVLIFVLSITALTSAKTEKVEIAVKGMTCDGCEASVSKALQQVGGVKAATVDHKKGKAVVEFDVEKTSLAKLETAIAKAGYTAGLIKTDNPHKCDSKTKAGCPAAAGCETSGATKGCCAGGK